jgi:hypothetical protein
MFQIIQIDRSFLPAQRATERHLRKRAYGAHLECRYFFGGGREESHHLWLPSSQRTHLPNSSRKVLFYSAFP